jgi:hypothetical protein
MEAGVAASGGHTMLPQFESGTDEFAGQPQFQTGTEADDGDRRHFQTVQPDWEQVGSPVGSPVDLGVSEGEGEVGHLGMGPLPPQPPPNEPPLRRSARLSRAIPVLAEQEQSLGEGGD